jgi:hypothetical protein
VELAFPPEHLDRLSRALDIAWDMFLRSGLLTTRNIDTARTTLAFGILECAARGEQNPRRLAIGAVARYETTEKMRRRSVPVFRPERRGLTSKKFR